MTFCNHDFLSLKQCRVINEIMRKGSEKSASDSLNLSQPSVSRSLTQAEQTLQVKIFTRGWSGAELTTDGEIIISICHRILNAISEANDRLQVGANKALTLTSYLEWRHLIIVEAVNRLGSASGAAKILGITQPAVSSQQDLKRVGKYDQATTISPCTPWLDSKECCKGIGLSVSTYPANCSIIKTSVGITFT